MKIVSDSIKINGLNGYQNKILTVDYNGNLIASNEDVSGAGAGGVTTLNTLSGNLQLIQGTNVLITDNGSNQITISAVISGGGTDHNTLANLQGGTTNQYYHLTATQYSDFIGETEVAGISGYLQTQINQISPVDTTIVLGGTGIQVIESSNDTFTVSVSGSYATNSQLASLTGSLQYQINTIPLSAYTTRVETANISGYLNTRINNITDTSIVLGGTGIQVIESPNDTFTVSVSGNYATTSQVTAASANAYIQSIAYTNNKFNTVQTQIDTITGATHVIMGEIWLNTINDTYTISHENINNPHPLISVITPTSSSPLLIANLSNVTNSGFTVVLSDIPDVSGYSIKYVVGILQGYDGSAFVTLTSNSNITLDFAANETIAVLDGLNTNCNISTSNLNGGKVYGLRLRDNGVSRTITWPGGWSWLTESPSGTTTNKWMIVTMESLGITDANILVDWKNQP